MIDADELKTILENHKHYLAQDCDGWERMQANLCETDLRSADLSLTNLSWANLHGADLRLVDLRAANLHRANLTRADLRGANLSFADLHGADLSDADIRGARIFVPLACPSDGEFIAWKRVEDKLVKLRIPSDAKRCSATTNKCRCDKAYVEGIYNLDGTESELVSIVDPFNGIMTYNVSEMVYPDSFDGNRWNEYSHGIHFFVDRESAILN